MDLKELKAKLIEQKIPDGDVKKFLAYVQGELHKERNKDKKPVTSNSTDILYTLFMKFHALGLVIDGVNIVITGKAMAMVTFHGYKNKVLTSYPTAIFDIQLVRGDDKFIISKENGKLTYSHEIANPFGDDEIKGAYCIITIDDAQYFEALNQKDFESMKDGSKMKQLWTTWDSEFWLKSVTKRACKRHFYNEVKEIDEVDNDDFGQTDKPQAVSDPEEVATAIKQINEAADEDELRKVFMSSGLINDSDVIAAKNARKAELGAKNASSES